MGSVIHSGEQETAAGCGSSVVHHPLLEGGSHLRFTSIAIASVAIALILVSTSIAAEPPAITRMFPPGGQVGTNVEVTLTGKPGDGNLQVWSDQQKLSVAFSEKNDKATIKIPADAARGIHWLRFYNESGATDLIPFFVGELPEAMDAEPNNDLAKAQKISACTVNGVLHQTGEVDLFAIGLGGGPDADRTGAGKPRTWVADGWRLGNTRCSRNGDLTSNDDDHGNDPRQR